MRLSTFVLLLANGLSLGSFAAEAHHEPAPKDSHAPANEAHALAKETNAPAPAKPSNQAEAMHTEVIDGWIHFGGSSYHRHKIAGRDALKSLLPGA